MISVILFVPILLIAFFIILKKESTHMETPTPGANAGSSASSSALEEKKSPAFHLFLYLVMFLSLGFLVTGTIGSYFQLVNKYFPMEVDQFGYSRGVDQNFLKFAVSYLLVAIPIYFGMFHFINKKLVKGEIRPDSLIRKFVTYIAMFVFSVMALGSLVSLVYNYLDGELTTRALLKILVFFVVSAFFFAFYFWEVRRTDLTDGMFKKLFWVALALAVSGFIVGLLIVDSPRVVREKKQDEQLMERMRTLSYTIEEFYRDKKRLPEQEKKEIDLADEIEYTRVNENEYQLCGAFKQTREELYADDNWNHPAGRHCFSFNMATITSPDFPEPIRVK